MAATEEAMKVVIRETHRSTLFFKQDYSQKELIKSFQHYLKSQNADIETRQAFSGGLCSGLSMVFSTFHNQDKRQWWTTLLKQIIQHQHLFFDEHYLNSIATDWHLPDEKAEQTHRQLIERAINYVLFTHASFSYMPPHFKTNLINKNTFNQETYFQRKTFTYRNKKKYYDTNISHEFLTNKGRRMITYSEKIAGYFNPTLLSGSIEIKDIKANIVKISNHTHTCALIYDSQSHHFGFYDPNLESGEALWFVSKNALAEHIIQSLGPELIIAGATTNATITPLFYNFKTAIRKGATLTSLIPDESLAFVFFQTPEVTQPFLNKLKNTPARYKNIVSHAIRQLSEKEEFILTYQTHLLAHLLSPSQANHEALSDVMSLLTLTQDEDNFLYILLENAPEICKQLSARVKGEAVYINAIIKALSAWSPLHWHEVSSNSAMKLIAEKVMSKPQNPLLTANLIKRLTLVINAPETEGPPKP